MLLLYFFLQVLVTQIMQVKMEPVNILLLGRNGNGKSSTGNSILGRNVFTPRSVTQESKDEISLGSFTIDNKKVNVVEGPGIGDTDLNDEADILKTFKNADQAVSLCNEGFIAVVFILKYGVRFTQQEKDTVKLIKEIFGANVLRDYGIILMTNGDSFAYDNEDDKKTFNEWCDEQTGDVKTLFVECGKRLVLFNNKEKDFSQQNAQRDKLMAEINKIHQFSMAKEKYSMKSYKQAEPSRKRLVLQTKIPYLKEIQRKVLDEISLKLNKINIHADPDSSLYELKDIQDKLARHVTQLRKEAEGTNVFDGILVEVNIWEQNLNTKIRTAEMAKEYGKITPDRRFGRPDESSPKDDILSYWMNTIRKIYEKNTKSFLMFLFTIFVLLFTLIYLIYLKEQPAQIQNNPSLDAREDKPVDE